MGDTVESALILKIGAPVGVPAAGTKALGLDSNGNAQLIDSTGASTSVGGGIGWDALQWQRIQALLGTQVTDYQWTDLLNPNEYDITAGTGPFAQLAASAAGVIRNGAGTATLYLAGQKTGSGTVIPIPNMKTSAWAVAGRVRFAAAPAGAGKFLDICGMGGASKDCTLRIETDLSTTVLSLQQTDAGVTKTAANSVGTIGGGIALSTWFDVLLVNDPSGGRVVAQINGVTAATSTVLTNQSTEACRPNISTNQNTSVDVDAMLLAFKREP